MGTLRSLTDWSHQMTVNGVELGDPVELDGNPATFEWDDSAFPNGTIDADGNVHDDDGQSVSASVVPVSAEGFVES